ncbi:MAG: shikimate dehydrogenase family protein [Thermotogota bacterium]
MKLFLLKQKPGPGMSKKMFDSISKELKINLEYNNLVTPEDYYKKVLSRLMEDSEVVGFNVTIPYKVKIRSDVLADDDVSSCGAVNCVRVNHEKKQFLGYNTDWKGIYKPLQTKNINSAIVAGAGGASRAAIYALTKLGVASIHLFNRTRKSAQEIQQIFPTIQIHDLETLDQFLKNEKQDLLINTTPLGMNPNPRSCLPLTIEALKNCRIVFDIVYKPLQTKLLTLAKNAGCTCINGLEMLVEQHIENVKIWDLPKKEQIIECLKTFKKPL